MCGLYNFDKNNNLYSFNGSLEEFLIKRGVSEYHINEMKNKKLECSRSAYYNYLGGHRSIELVPLDKVIGTSRSTPGWSVFDNVNKMFLSDREPSRFTFCLNFFNIMSLSELKKSYEELSEPVRMTYYIDDDVYYLEGDGNHRTLIAMLIGAENILAKVTRAKCNYIKKKIFYKEKEFRKKNKIVEIKKNEYFNVYEIIFFDGCGNYSIKEFEGKKINESVVDLINRLSNTINRDKKIVEFLVKHSILRNIVLFYLKKKDFKRYLRIKNYIIKQYLSPNQFISFSNYQRICLYDLYDDEL